MHTARGLSSLRFAYCFNMLSQARVGTLCLLVGVVVTVVALTAALADHHCRHGVAHSYAFVSRGLSQRE